MAGLRAFKNERVMSAALPALLTFLVYLPTAGYDFVNWDDMEYLPIGYAGDISDTGAFLWWAFASADVSSNWHPLTILSFTADFLAFGLDPAYYHIENNLIHGVNTFLAGLLAARLYALGAGKDEGSSIAGAVTALLFGLHPLRVESVAWVSERKDLLCALFYLLSVMSYLSYAAHAHGKRAAGYAFSIAFFLLAILSKPMAVSLPIVLMIIDFYPLRRFEKGPVRGVLIEKAPFLALSVMLAVITIYAQDRAIAGAAVLPLASRLYVAVYGAAFYLYKTVLPVGLAPMYPLFPWELSFMSATFLLSLSLLLLVSAVCLAYAGKHRVLIAGWIFYLVTLAPVSGIVQAGKQIAADRYAYLPSLGILMVAGALASRHIFNSGRGRAAKGAWLAAGAVLLTAMSAATMKQMSVWKDPVALWSREAEVFPQMASPYNHRGIWHETRGDIDAGIRDYTRAIGMNPQYAEAYYNRGGAFLKKGLMDEAFTDLDRAVELDRADERAYLGRATAFHLRGSPEEALNDISTAVILDPLYAEAFNNRGVFNLLAGRHREAEDDLMRAIGLRPNYAEPHLNMAFLYLWRGDAGKAGQSFERARRLKLERGQGPVLMGVSYFRSIKEKRH